MLGSLLAGAARGEEQTLHLSVIGPDADSPFKPQLKVQVTNESFMSYPLLDKVETSELLIDGKPYQRQDVLFDGPSGLAPQGSWEGCMGLEDFAPAGIPRGHHRLIWQVGSVRSEEVSAWIPGTAPAATTAKERFRQVDALRDALSPGLSKRCVENWLTERDGGLASAHAVRYYVDPDVKVLVPYEESGPQPIVNGPVKIYNESRVAD